MKRSPAAAVILSLIPGLGHIYLGLVSKGAVFVLLFVGLLDIIDRGADSFGVIVPVFIVFAMVDAYRSAHAINQGEVLGDPFSGASAKWWGGSLIVAGVLFLLYNFNLFDFEWLWNLWPLALIGLGIKLLRPPTSVSATPPAATPEPPPPVPETPEEDLATASEGEPTEAAAAEGTSGESLEQGETHDRPEAD